MAVATRRTPVAADGPAAPARTTFRPSSRSRVRIAVGALLAATSIGVMLLIFSTADKRVPVLQLVHDVPAGQRLTDGDFRVIEVSSAIRRSPSFTVRPAIR